MCKLSYNIISSINFLTSLLLSILGDNPRQGARDSSVRAPGLGEGSIVETLLGGASFQGHVHEVGCYC